MSWSSRLHSYAGRVFKRFEMKRTFLSNVWAVSLIAALALIIWCSWEDNLNPSIAIVVAVLSLLFFLIAQIYRMFLFSDSGKMPTARKEDISVVVAHTIRPNVEIAAQDSMQLEEEKKKRDKEEEKLEEEFRERFGMQAYMMCVLPTIMASLIGWSLLLEPVPLTTVATGEEGTPGTHADGGAAKDGKANREATGDDNKDKNSLAVLDPRIAEFMGIGFLGALMFCFQLLWRRLTTWDLKPTIFLRCASAMFTGMALNFVVFSAFNGFAEFSAPGEVEENPDGTGHLLAYVVAFSLGYFPMLGIRWFTRISHQATGEPARRADFQRLLTVDGITLFHEERLLEEGIQNQHDMAYADVANLLIKTPYSARQLLDWIDQCALLLFLSASEADGFRRGGVRTASDLLAIWQPLESGRPDAGAPDSPPDTTWEASRKQIATMLQTLPERMDAIYKSLDASRKTTP